MKKQIKLMPRDLAILDHLAEFDVTTKKVLHKAFYEGRRMKAVDSTIRRLDARGVGFVFGCNQPNSRTQYFQLTPEGAAFLGTKANKQPLAISKLFTLVGRLYFINRPPENRERKLCSATDLQRLISAADYEPKKIRLPRVDFYIARNNIEGAEDQEVCFGAILPDLNSSVERVVKRVVNHSMSIVERGWFLDMMKAGRFEWTILTGHKAKEEELLQAATRVLRRRMASLYFHNGLDLLDYPPIKVKVEVIPELATIRLLKKKKKKTRDSS